ncbi:MAG: hypothetical protein WBD40_23675 [Tepidisphaeraceae bacterium]
MGNARTSSFVRLEGLERRWLLTVFAADVSFGAGGHADVAGEILLEVLPDGKVLIVGETPEPPERAGQIDPGPWLEKTAARLNPDGTFDTSFSGDGRLDVGEARDAIASGPRLWVIDRNRGGDVDPLRVFGPDGELDTGFSGDGQIEVPARVFSGDELREARAHFVAATPDGGVILRVDVTTENRRNVQLAKLKPDGTLDTTFGEIGFVVFASSIPSFPPTVSFTWTSQSLSVHRFTEENVHTLTRYSPDGRTIDTSFGESGTVVLASLPSIGLAPRVYEQADGKLLVVLSDRDDNQDPFVDISRLNADGSPDTGFGTAGSIRLNDQGLTDLALDAQQRIVVTTSKSLYRFSPAGVLDAAPFDGSLSADKVSGLIAFDAAGRLLIGDTGDVTRFDFGDEVLIGRDGAIYVRGTDADDQATIAAGSGGMIDVTLNGDVTQFDTADVSGIGVFLEQGDNTVSVSLDLPTTVVTGDGSDTITTADGNDSITAGGGDDNVVSIGDGDDVVDVGSFLQDTDHSTVTGGDGNKRVSAAHGAITLTLGVGDNEVATGQGTGEFVSHITIAGGNNTVLAGGGSDVVIIGGNGANFVRVTGNDTPPGTQVTTGDGDDEIILHGGGTVQTNGGDDLIRVSQVFTPLTIFAGDGDDRVLWSRNSIVDVPPATVFGGNGDDFIEAFAGANALHGNAGHDTLIGGDGSDLISGGGGHDRLIGGLGKDRIYGGAGFDTIDGGSGDDRLFGQDGRDKLYGGAGNDQLFGGASGDWLYAQRGGDDELFGEGGNDRIYADYATGTQTLHGNAGDDLLVSNDSLIDHLFGDGGRDAFLADEDDVRTSVETDAPVSPAPEPAFENFVPFGPETTVPASAAVFTHKMAVAGNGSFIVANIVGVGANPQDVEVVRYGADGRQIGEILSIDPSIADSTYLGILGAAMDGDGDAVVAYGIADGELSVRLFIVRISKTGVVSSPTLVTEGLVNDVAVAMDHGGGFFVAWSNNGSPSEGPSIAARAYDAAGAPRGEPFPVVTEGDFTAELFALNNVKIAARPNGAGAVLAFHASDGGGSSGVRFARISPSARIGEVRAVDDNNGTSFPAVAAFADGSFVIGFSQSDNGHAQRFDAAGFAQGGRIELGTSNGDGGGVTGIELDDLPEGGFVAVFRRRVDGNRGNELLVRRVDRTGASDPAVVVSTDDGALGPTGIGVDDSGTAVVTYLDLFHSAARFRRVASDVAVLDGSELYVFGTEADDAIDVSTDAGSLLVTRGTRVRTFDPAQVTALSVNGFGGDDTITNNTALPSTLHGGDGKDTITGGSGPDRIRGQGGDDQFIANDGAIDQLFGDGGRDTADAEAMTN